MDVCQGPAPGSIEGWYLQEAASPSGLPPTAFFMSYGEGGAAGPLGGPDAELEPELLAYGENAENEEQLPAPDVLQVRLPGGGGRLVASQIVRSSAGPRGDSTASLPAAPMPQAAAV